MILWRKAIQLVMNTGQRDGTKNKEIITLTNIPVELESPTAGAPHAQNQDYHVKWWQTVALQ